MKHAAVTALVRDNQLQLDGQCIAVGSAAWYTWLAEANAFRYEHAQGSYGARRERFQRGGSYWKAYRRVAGKLRRAYLGRSEDLVIERLERAAVLLADHLPMAEQPAAEVPTLLWTKLAAPQAGLVERSELVRRLDGVLQHRLTVIAAPPGWGKTTLLANWIEHRHGNHAAIAWLSLDSADDDPARLWSYICTALGAYEPAALESEAAIRAPRPPELDRLVSGLINAIARSSPGRTIPIVLILDDYHCLTNPLIHEALTLLIDRLPQRLHVILTSRVEPPLPLARWRAAGQLLELRADDLRFAIDDSARLLALVAAQELAPNTARALVERTEGWAAGLHLAGLVLRAGNPSEQSALVAQISGSHPYILDYLVDEILRRQPPHIQEFLLQTSILDRLCGELCDAILGDQRDLLSPSQYTSATLLSYLERANLFITPLDTERRWFRYHQLFADALQAQLQRTHPQLMTDLHRRAMQWYRQQAMTGAMDFATPAINHAIAAGQHVAAALLIERHGLSMLFVRGEIQTLLGWLSALPEMLRMTRPRILVTEAWALLATVQLDRVEQAIEMAEAYASPEDSELIGEIIAIQSFVVHINGDSQASIELGQRSLALLSAEQKTVRYLIAVNLANAYVSLGELYGAWAIVEQMRRDMRYLPDPAVFLSGYGLELVESDLLLSEGRAIEAESVVRQLLKQITGRYGERLTMIPMIHVALAEICYERNNLEECERLTHSAMEKGEQWWNSDILCPAYDLYGRILRIRGDMAGALAAHRKSRELAIAYNVAKITWWAQLGEVWEAFEQGNLAATECGLTERGLRIDGELDPVRYAEYELLVRLQLAQGRVTEAITLIKRIAMLAEQGGYTRRVIGANILAALAYWQSGRAHEAYVAIGLALEQARPGGMRRCFLDEGEPMHQFLRTVLEDQDTRFSSDLQNYVMQLLAAFPLTGNDPGIQSITLNRASTQSADRLTARELAVLRLVATGASNQDIAKRLVVSLHTVKKHLTHILAKLNTTSRTAAVARAHERQLL